MNYVVFKTRKKICDCFDKNIEVFDYRDTCNYAQAIISYYFDDLGLLLGSKNNMIKKV